MHQTEMMRDVIGLGHELLTKVVEDANLENPDEILQLLRELLDGTTSSKSSQHSHQDR